MIAKYWKYYLFIQRNLFKYVGHFGKFIFAEVRSLIRLFAPKLDPIIVSLLLIHLEFLSQYWTGELNFVW